MVAPKGEMARAPEGVVMKNILIIGATGQIGSELTMTLRGIYGNEHVICGYIPSAAPKASCWKAVLPKSAT